MRTTVDLPDAVRRRAEQLAHSRGESLSSTIADLALRGLTQLDEPISIDIDRRSGFPVMSFGHRITDDDVAAALDDE